MGGSASYRYGKKIANARANGASDEEIAELERQRKAAIEAEKARQIAKLNAPVTSGVAPHIVNAGAKALSSSGFSRGMSSAFGSNPESRYKSKQEEVIDVVRRGSGGHYLDIKSGKLGKIDMSVAHNTINARHIASESDLKNYPRKEYPWLYKEENGKLYATTGSNINVLALHDSLTNKLSKATPKKAAELLLKAYVGDGDMSKYTIRETKDHFIIVSKNGEYDIFAISKEKY